MSVRWGSSALRPGRGRAPSWWGTTPLDPIQSPWSLNSQRPQPLLPLALGSVRSNNSRVRFGFHVLCLMVLVSGCRNLPPPEPVRPVVKQAPVRLIQPLDGQVGQVLSINTRLGFVVLDYSLTGLPRLGDVLDLWRQQSIVGRLKVSGPILNTTAVADVVSGNPQVGDLARPASENLDASKPAEGFRPAAAPAPAGAPAEPPGNAVPVRDPP